MIRPLKLQTIKSVGKEDKGTISSRIKGGKGFKGNNKGRQDGIGFKKGSNKPASSSAVVDDGSDSPANYYKTDDSPVASVTEDDNVFKRRTRGGKRFNKAPEANPGVVTNTSKGLRRPTVGQSQLPGKGLRPFGGIRPLKSQPQGTKPPQVHPQRTRLALGQPQGQRPLQGQKIALGTKLALGQRPPRVQGKGEKSAKSSQGQTTQTVEEVKKPASILPGRKLGEKPMPVPAGVKKSFGMRTPIPASTGVAPQMHVNRTKLAFKKPLPNNVRNPPRIINQRPPASVSPTAPMPKPQLNKPLRPNRPSSLGQFPRPGLEVRSQAAQANSNSSSSSNSRPVISQFKSVKTVIKQQLKGGGAIRPTMKQQMRKIPSTLGAVQRNNTAEQAQPTARRMVPTMQTPMGKPLLLGSNLSSFNKNTSASSKMGVNTAPVVEAAKFPKKSVGLQKPMLKLRTQDRPQVSVASQASSRPSRVGAPSMLRSFTKPQPSASATKPQPSAPATKPLPSASATKPQPSAPATPAVPAVRKTERFPPTGRVAQKIENRFPRVPPARAMPYVPGKVVAPPLNRSDRPTSKSTSVAASKFLNQK